MMKIDLLFIGLLCLVLTRLSLGWSKDDREIFRIRDELSAHETTETTFYELLGLGPSASLDDITKAHRRLTKALHPDKVQQRLRAERAQSRPRNPGQNSGVPVTKPLSAAEVRTAVKEASERQTRLSLVAKILKGPGRDRYDHFLQNGFPVWKGTEYYYNRYRPGLFTVLAGLSVVCGGGIHYLALYMSWRRQREFFDRYIRFARETAWGRDLNLPGLDAASAPNTLVEPDDGDNDQASMRPTNRKQRRMQERGAKKDAGRDTGKTLKRPVATERGQVSAPDGPTGAKKRVIAENGKVLVVDSVGNVYLEQADEDGTVDELLLDPHELPRPSFRDTLIVSLPIWLFRTASRYVLAGSARAASKPDVDGLTVEQAVSDNGDDSDAALRTPSSDSVDDFELLDKLVDSVAKPKTTGAQAAAGGKAGKRKTKKR